MRKSLCAVIVASAACAASAQHSDDFENGFTSSPAGETLNGQNGYYQPVDGSDSALVFDYASNALGFPQNPNGGNVFVGGTGMANGVFVRSQKDVPYPAGVVTVGYDICAGFLGDLPASQNTGSFSTQTFPGDSTYIHLARWSDVNVADTWNADMVWFNAAGTQLTEVVPDPAFQNLLNNHWYRWTGTFDLATNQVLQLSITDLTTGITTTHDAVDRYLFGGEAGGAPPPDGFRFFVGSSTIAGNTLGFDNVSVEGSGGCADACGDIDGDGDSDSDDFFAYLDQFFNGDPCADIDGDGDIDSDDFFGYLDLFVVPC